MSKHRRPSRLTLLRQVNSSPLNISVAAGVAGTVAISGTVVASAADGSGTLAPAAAAQKRAPAATAILDTVDPGTAAGNLALKDAVTAEQRAAAQRLAEAKARALAKRRAEARAAARRAAEKRAEEARQFTSASRGGIERTSASAANVLRIAAQVASGASYSYGGAGPSNFDCSGYTAYVFDKVGISLPHSSSAQRSIARPVDSPQPGDLVFVYNGPGGSIGHVGIYAGNGYWWEAANPNTGVGKHKAWSSNVSYGRVL